MLEEHMFSEYTKCASFIISDGEKTSEGKLTITKGECNTLEFTSPESLSGITVESDSTGKEGTYTMSFDGVSTDVPKSLMGKISLVFVLLSDDVASGVKKLKNEAFYKVTDDSVLPQSQGKVLYGAKLKISDTLILLTYDSLTGEILSMSASSGKDSATLIFDIQ